VFPHEAADVAMQAIQDGVARKIMTREQVYARAKEDITLSRAIIDSLMKNGFIKQPPQEMIQEAVDFAIKAIAG